MWPEWVGDGEATLALARGELPAGVDPDTALGRHYRDVIDTAERDLAAAPPLKPGQIAAIVALLRPGGFGHE